MDKLLMTRTAYLVSGRLFDGLRDYIATLR
jgi:hypothetical protein